jgi:hypothetical protein
MGAMNDLERARDRRLLRERLSDPSAPPVYGVTVPVSGRATVRVGDRVRELDVDTGDRVQIAADAARPGAMPSVTISYDVP